MLLDSQQRDIDFWDLWENNKNLFFSKCMQLMNGDVCRAEDALSAAMLKAQEKMIPYRERISNFQRWALRLTENVCRDQLRKERRLISYNGLPESLIHNESDHDSHFTESADKYLSREAIFKVLFEYICNLPRRLRDPVLLRFFFFESYRDIAGRLSITEENARKRVQEARSALKLQYGEKSNALLCSAEGVKISQDSLVIKTIRQAAHSILETVESELELCCKTAWAVNIMHITGTDREILVVLPLIPGWNKKGFTSILKYISRHPRGWKRHLELAQMLYAMGMWDMAEKEFHHILNKRPRSFSTRVLLGNMLMESGKEEEAAHLFQEASSLAYRDSSRYFLSGMVAMCRARPLDAMASFEKAKGLEPSNVTFRHAKGICLFRSGHYAGALRFFQNILTEKPGDIVSLAHCCEASIILNQQMQAGEYADRILDNNPHDLFALRRKSLLVDQGCGCSRQTDERKRLQRLSERFELFARMMHNQEYK